MARGDDDEQLAFDLWGTPEPAADAQLAAARTAPAPTARGEDFQPDLDLFADDGSEGDRDEQVRAPSAGSLAEARPGEVRSPGGPDGVLHDTGGERGRSDRADQAAARAEAPEQPGVPGRGSAAPGHPE